MMPRQHVQLAKVGLLACTIPLLLFLASLDLVWMDLKNYDPIFLTNNFDYGSSVRTTQELITYFTSPISQPLNFTSFSPKEASHLHDVKMAFKLGGLVFGLLVLLWLFAFAHSPNMASKAVMWGGVLTLAILALIALTPFDFTFTAFHGILFKPGTWVFYPNELIVTIYPKRLFIHLAQMIAWRMAGLAVLLIPAGWLLGKVKSACRLYPAF